MDLSLYSQTLLEIVDKYGVPVSQWAWLCQTLLEVSMNKIALWINVCADDWAAEMSTISSNEAQQSSDKDSALANDKEANIHKS